MVRGTDVIDPQQPVWEFDVYYTTHDLLQHGITEAARSRIELAARDYLEAQRLAVWMVICRSGFYVTRAECVGVQALPLVDGQGELQPAGNLRVSRTDGAELGAALAGDPVQSRLQRGPVPATQRCAASGRGDSEPSGIDGRPHTVDRGRSGGPEVPISEPGHRAVGERPGGDHEKDATTTT
jgi:hypothetical protein